MRRGVLIALTIACTAGMIAISIGSHTVSAQDDNQDDNRGEEPPPVYNPYPPGILPADLEPEIARVLREIDVIEQRAIARWLALPLRT